MQQNRERDATHASHRVSREPRPLRTRSGGSSTSYRAEAGVQLSHIPLQQNLNSAAHLASLHTQLLKHEYSDLTCTDPTSVTQRKRYCWYTMFKPEILVSFSFQYLWFEINWMYPFCLFVSGGRDIESVKGDRGGTLRV